MLNKANAAVTGEGQHVLVSAETAALLAPPTMEGGGQPWTRPALGEVLAMETIQKAKKEYHSHRGVNSFEKGAHAVGDRMHET